VRGAAKPRRAIVLGGGGVLGFAWTLGALSAVEEVAGFDVRTVDVVIGTSAGSVAAALLGCGLPVEAICRHHQGQPAVDDPVFDYDYATATGSALPPRPRLRPGSPRLFADAVRRRGGGSALVALSGLLPVGRGTLAPVHDLIAGVAAQAGFEADWPARPRPWIVAVDYRTGRRIVFGRDGLAAGPDRVPRIVRQARLADAVTASCSIPGWYPPHVIDSVPYIDGGTASNASVDVVGSTTVTEAYVLAPMASVETDRPRSAVARVERAIRRAVTRGVLADVAVLRASGVRVCLITPGPEDLSAIGVNLMNPATRTEVLETSRVSSAATLRRQLSSRTNWRNAGDSPVRGRTPGAAVAEIRRPGESRG
jgi:NTE family protein